MKIVAQELSRSLYIGATLAEFGKPIDDKTKSLVQEYGLSEGRSVGCLKWIWHQWLAGAPATEIRDRVEPLVKLGMEMRLLTAKFEGRVMHDLFLLHCAALVCNETQLYDLAVQVVDSSGDGKHTPEQRFGELYASAWCGMLKYWILGDESKAIKESDILWGAYKDPSFHAAPKTLVAPWLKRDWKAFAKAQKKDFDRLWTRARKDGTVISENQDEIVVKTINLSIPQLWCWAHCGLAVLAHRRFGVEVVTDPLWFPSHALEGTPKLGTDGTRKAI
jgi:hypothetical protein